MSTEPEYNINDYIDALEAGAEYDYLPNTSSIDKIVIKEGVETTEGVDLDLPTITARKTQPGYPTRKEFVVLLKKDAEFSLAFETDMEETQGAQTCYDLEDGTPVCSATPTRAVAPSVTKSSADLRVYKYYLTEQEAENLKQDFRVDSVSVSYEQTGVILEPFEIQTGNFTRETNGKSSSYNFIQIIITTISGSFIDGEEIFQVEDVSGQSALIQNATAKAKLYKKIVYNLDEKMLYIKPTSENPVTGTFLQSSGFSPLTGMYSSVQTIKGATSGAEATVNFVTYHNLEDSNWGLARSSSYGNTENPVPNEYLYSLDGTGVDVVIIDTGIDVNHPEFEDANGNSRVQVINWWQAAGINFTPFFPLSDYYKDNSGHGTHVAGTVAGKTFGWAKNAKIYAMKIFNGPFLNENDLRLNEVEAALYLLIEWHKRKPIDPNTGVKRPTIVNCSWGFSTSVGINPHILTPNNQSIFCNSQLSPTGIKSINYRGTVYNSTIASNFNPFEPQDLYQTIPSTLLEMTRGLYCCFGSIFSPNRSGLYVFKNIGATHIGSNDNLGNVAYYLAGTSCGVRLPYIDSLIADAIEQGIHFCLAAGNEAQRFVKETSQDYNNYATIQYFTTLWGTIDVHNNLYRFLPETSWPDIVEENLYFNRKGTPYHQNAIIVGSIDNLKVVEDTNDSLTKSNFEDGNVLEKETRSSFSNYGSGVDIWAGGSDIISSVALPDSSPSNTPIFGSPYYGPNPYFLDENYGQIKFSGTSMASPQVCGVGALFLQKDPTLTPVELKQKILEYSIQNGVKDGFENVTNESLNYPIRNPSNGQRLTFCCSNSCPSAANTIKFNTTAARSILSYGTYDPAPILYSPFSAFVPQQDISVTFGTSQVTFSWTYSKSPTHSHYDIYRSTFQGFGYEKLNSSPVLTESYQDSTVIPGTTYYYRIYSVDVNDVPSEADTIIVNFQNFNSLSKIIIYPVIYRRDTDGNIVKDQNGLKIVEKSYREVNINDDYTIITDIKDAE